MSCVGTILYIISAQISTRSNTSSKNCSQVSQIHSCYDYNLLSYYRQTNPLKYKSNIHTAYFLTTNVLAWEVLHTFTPGNHVLLRSYQAKIFHLCCTPSRHYITVPNFKSLYQPSSSSSMFSVKIQCYNM